MKLLFNLLLLCTVTVSFAQKDTVLPMISNKQVATIAIQLDTIQGQVLDRQTKEPLIFATVAIYKTGSETPFTGLETDIDGNYMFLLPKGNYDIEVNYTGYQTVRIEGLVLDETKIGLTRNIELDAGMSSGKEIMIITTCEPLIRLDKTTSGRTFTKRDIEKSPLKW